MKNELNEKQKQFCLEYLKDFNATRAYKKIYWVSDETARPNASRLLTNDNIQEYLASKAQKKVEEAEVWVDYVLKNLHEIVEIWMWRQKICNKIWKQIKRAKIITKRSLYNELFKRT